MDTCVIGHTQWAQLDFPVKEMLRRQCPQHTKQCAIEPLDDIVGDRGSYGTSLSPAACRPQPPTPTQTADLDRSAAAPAEKTEKKNSLVSLDATVAASWLGIG